MRGIKDLSGIGKKKSELRLQLVRAGAVIGIVAVFCAALLAVYWKSQCTHAIEDANDEYIASTATADRYLEQMKYTLAEMSMDSNLYAVADGKLDEGDADYSKVTETLRSSVFLRKQNEFAQHLETVFIVPLPECDSILDSSGTFRRDMFFDSQYKNAEYTDEFWTGELSRDFSFELYPASRFESARDSSVSGKLLTPIAYKMSGNNNFIFVGLFDLFGIPGVGDNAAVFDKNGKTIALSSNGYDLSDAFVKNVAAVERVKNGYVFRCNSQLDGLVYYRWISHGELFGKINLTVSILFLLLIIVCAAAFALAWVFARKDSALISNISRAVSERCGFENADETGASLETIRFGVDELVKKNDECIREITQKDALLKTVFLQSRMRDIYVSIDDMENQVSVSRKFVLVYFRVTFREQYRQNINEEQGKVAFYLKQLIELYMTNAGLDATTFQVESDQIVSVVNAEDGQVRINEAMESIVSKLDNESEYVFFTVVISEPYEDIRALKRIYDHMYAISKYARPIVTETQVLRESEIKPGAGRFYFSVEQMEKLTAMLQNENPEDSIRLLDEILEYNIKKDVNGFDLYLLCTEIVNCAVKLINRLFHTTPASLRVAETYSRLDKAIALDQYRAICKTLIEQAVEYIRINKREEDYIISYILDYVENHYTEDIYLNLFAEKLKLTAAYISSYFKSKMNVNLSDYINSFRIKKAVALVEDSQNPMLKNKEIAERVGIANINTFIRLFKKYTGYTPGDYRKKNVSE